MRQPLLFGDTGAPTVFCPLGCEALPRPSKRGHICADCGVEFSTLDPREKEGGEPCQARPPAADQAPVPRGSTRQDTPRQAGGQAVKGSSGRAARILLGLEKPGEASHG